MTPLTVKEALRLKGEAEVAIHRLISQFETATGVAVQRIDIDAVGSTEGRERTVDVHLIATLNRNHS